MKERQTVAVVGQECEGNPLTEVSLFMTFYSLRLYGILDLILSEEPPLGAMPRVKTCALLHL